MNPKVRKITHRILSNHERIQLIEPLSYEPFIHLMKAAYIVLTDSGGIQEEAPVLGKPVLVVRNSTERLEAVKAGNVKVIGTKQENIIKETEQLLSNTEKHQKMANLTSPYGDGTASKKIVRKILEHLG